MNQETREAVFRIVHGYCMCSKECQERATDAHHMLPNTNTNRKLYPLFIDSIFNLLPMSNDCHLTKPLKTIRPHEASIYEAWLQKFKGCEI